MQADGEEVGEEQQPGEQRRATRSSSRKVSLAAEAAQTEKTKEDAEEQVEERGNEEGIEEQGGQEGNEEEEQDEPASEDVASEDGGEDGDEDAGEEEVSGEDAGEESQEEDSEGSQEEDREEDREEDSDGSQEEVEESGEDDQESEDDQGVEDEQEEEERSQPAHATQPESASTRQQPDDPLADFEAAALQEIANDSSAIDDSFVESAQNPAATLALTQIDAAIAASTDYDEDFDAGARAASLNRRQVAAETEGLEVAQTTAIQDLATEANAFNEAVIEDAERNLAVTSALQRIHAIETGIAVSAAHQTTAIQDLAVESSAYETIIQNDADARAASLARRQVAEMEAPNALAQHTATQNFTTESNALVEAGNPDGASNRAASLNSGEAAGNAARDDDIHEAAIQEILTEANAIDQAADQNNALGDAASLSRQQQAETQAAVIQAIAVEAAAAQAKIDKAAADKKEAEAKAARIAELAQASPAIASGVSAFQQMVQDGQNERARFLEERAERRAAEREAEQVRRAREQSPAGSDAAQSDEEEVDPMARLAAERLPADEDLDFEGLEDTEVMNQDQDQGIPQNDFGGPDVDEMGLEDYEDDEMAEARRASRRSSAANLLEDAARQQAAYDEAARTQADLGDLEDADMPDDQGLQDQNLDEPQPDHDMPDEQELEEEVLGNPEAEDEHLDDQEQDLDLDDDFLDDVQVEEEDLEAREQERSSARAALLRAAEEGSAQGRAEEAARERAEQVESECERIEQEEAARQQAQQDEVARQLAESYAAAEEQAIKDEPARKKAEQDAREAKAKREFDEWNKSDQKRRQAAREAREIEELLREADDKDINEKRKQREKEKREKMGDKRAGDKRGPESDADDDSAKKKAKTSPENNLKTTTGQNEPDCIDSDSCKAFRNGMDMARFVYDPAAINSAPSGPAQVGQSMQLDTISQALASVTEAMNKTHVAANRPKVWSLFHPRWFTEHDVVGHPVALTRHNALVPMPRITEGKHPHFSLVFLLQKGFARRTYGGEDFFRMYNYDSNRASAKDFPDGVVRNEILKSGWPGRYDAEAQRILGQCQPTEPCEQPAGVEWASGIHVVLNGWACAFQLHHNRDALLHKTGFYENAVNLINLAIRGLVSSKLIIDFFECYEYTRVDTTDPLKRGLLTFKNSAQFETYNDLHEYILGLTGRLPPRTGSLNHSRPPTPVNDNAPGDDDDDGYEDDEETFSPVIPPVLDRYFEGVETSVRKGSESEVANNSKSKTKGEFAYDPDHVAIDPDHEDDVIIAELEEEDGDDYDENGKKIEPDLPPDDGPRFDWRGQLITPESRAKTAAEKAAKKKAEEARAKEAREREEAREMYGDDYNPFAGDDDDDDGNGDVEGLFDAEQDIDLGEEEEDLYNDRPYNAARDPSDNPQYAPTAPMYTPNVGEYQPSAADAAEEAFYSRQISPTTPQVSPTTLQFSPTTPPLTTRLPGLALPNAPSPTTPVPTAPSAGFPPPRTTQERQQQRQRQPPPPQITVNPPSASPIFPIRHPSVSALRATGNSRVRNPSRPRSRRLPHSPTNPDVSSPSSSSRSSSRRSSLGLAVAPDTPPPASSPPDIRTRMQQEEEQAAWLGGFGEVERDPDLMSALAEPVGRRGPEGTRYELEPGFEDPEGEFVLGDEVVGDDGEGAVDGPE